MECGCIVNESAWLGVTGRRIKLTVLLHLVAHDALLAGGLINFQEEAGLLIVVVFLDQPVPGESVGNKIWAIRPLQAGRLLVDAVETTDERIMADAHVRSFHSEAIGLIANSQWVMTERSGAVGRTFPVLCLGVSRRASG